MEPMLEGKLVRVNLRASPRDFSLSSCVSRMAVSRSMGRTDARAISQISSVPSERGDAASFTEIPKRQQVMSTPAGYRHSERFCACDTADRCWPLTNDAAADLQPRHACAYRVDFPGSVHGSNPSTTTPTRGGLPSESTPPLRPAEKKKSLQPPTHFSLTETIKKNSLASRPPLYPRVRQSPPPRDFKHPHTSTKPRGPPSPR